MGELRANPMFIGGHHHSECLVIVANDICRDHSNHGLYAIATDF